MGFLPISLHYDPKYFSFFFFFLTCRLVVSIRLCHKISSVGKSAITTELVCEAEVFTLLIGPLKRSTTRFVENKSIVSIVIVSQQRQQDFIWPEQIWLCLVFAILKILKRVMARRYSDLLSVLNVEKLVI